MRYERTSIGNRRFQGGWSIWPKISRRKRHPPPTICAQASQCITTLPLKVFTQRNFVADFLRKKSTFIRKTDTAFLSPLGGLGATYAVHPRLIGKPVVDLLLAIIELFSLGVRAEALRVIENIRFLKRERESVLPKISGRRGRLPPTILRARKLDELNFHMV